MAGSMRQRVHAVLDRVPEWRIILVLAAFMIAAALLSRTFLRPTNLSNIVLQNAHVGVVAVGMTFVILTAGIDLSVGGTVALVSVMMVGAADHGPIMMVVVGLFTGAVVGAVNGLLVTVGTITPFIATLGMMAVTRGCALWYAGGQPTSFSGEGFERVRAGFEWIGSGPVLGVPFPVVVLLVMVALTSVVLRLTVYGRRVYAVGSNPIAARAAGIDVNRTVFSVYVICGVMAAIGSILITGRLTAASPKHGELYELDAIAAVIIGGASLFGGRGSVLGTLVGVLILGVINNVLNLANVSSYAQHVAKGLVIIAAVVLQSGGYRGAWSRLMGLFR